MRPRCSCRRSGWASCKRLGLARGVENTNYFVDTDRGAYVLTLFERLSEEQLPFYLFLMKHLASRGLPVPGRLPMRCGHLVHRLKDKPAAVATRLQGASELAPTVAHCRELGGMLARMHMAVRDYDQSQRNLRGLAWWNETAPSLLPFLDDGQRALMVEELAVQNRIAESAESADSAALPRGPIHADLFRDNAMFLGDRLSGILDFYFAGCDSFLFDVAVCLNDWCIEWDTGRHHRERAGALLLAYQAVRPLEDAERRLLPGLQRAGAFRFWISRLWDFNLPREAAVLQAHDPRHFERGLRERAGGSVAQVA